MDGRVLVIDDDQRVLDAIVRTLQIENIPVEGEIDPVQAIEKFRNSPTDVVIVDFQYDLTPHITGLDVVSEIKKIKPFTRTILISGRIDHQKLTEKDLENAVHTKAGCDYYLIKSGDRDTLVRTVQEALTKVNTIATDWQAIASEYVAIGKVQPEDIRSTNESIKKYLIEAMKEQTGDDE